MKHFFSVYKKFMHGFSYIIPLTVVGGVFLTLFTMYPNTSFFDLGDLAYFLIYPVLAAYIAFAIGDRPAFILGLLGGALVTLGESGFLGATIVGFLSGYLVVFFNIIFGKLPTGLRGLKPVFMYPLLGAFVIIFLVMGLEVVIPPINIWVSTLYLNLDRILILFFAMILSAMMALGLGGPLNKAAYVIAVLTVLQGTQSIILPAVMIAGMMPPLVISFAALTFKKKFNDEERRLAKNNWLLGLSFITEGAIPFIKKDKKIIYILTLASVCSGVMTVVFNVTSLVVHGGIFSVFFMDKWLYFIITLLIVTIFFGFITGLLLKEKQE